MRFLISIVFYFFLLQPSFGQFNQNYHPESVTDSLPSTIQKIMKKRLEDDKFAALYSTKNKELNKYKASLYESRYKELMEEFHDKNFFVDDTITRYLRGIADKIYEANPQLKREATIYVYRTDVPNATSYGEGTIAFNQGLLAILENESQIAFILCHELAHYHQKHSEKRIQKLADLNYDKELEKQIKKIKNTSTNQYAQIKELFKEINFNHLRHSRTSENEADSVGLSYLIRSPYNAWEAVRTMEILDSCDVKPLYNTPIDLKKHFDFKDYPFQNSWLQLDSSDYEYASDHEILTDTSSTHPDCKKRIRILDYYLHTMAVPRKSNNVADPQVLAYIKTINKFELLESLCHRKDLGALLVYTLQSLESYPDNSYLNAMLGKCLYSIYNAEKIKELGKSVPYPDKQFDPIQNQVYTFIYNLRISELDKISCKYMDLKKSIFKDDEEFLYSLFLTSKLPNSTVNTELVIADYKKQFPKGKYITMLNEKN